MTEIETTIPGRRITAGPTELRIENTNTNGMIWARLLNDDAKKVADALLGRKPGDEYVDWKALYEQAERTCDELRSLIEGQKANVSAALARARAAERQRHEAHTAYEKVGRDRDAAVERADEWKQKAQRYINKFNRARNFNVEMKARADIEKALRECTNDVFASHAYPHMADAVCALFGIEAEQAVDPVEERVDALADAVYGDELVTDQMRGVLERVVRSGMLHPEQEADQ